MQSIDYTNLPEKINEKNLQRQVKKVISDISKEISNGKIDIKSYKGKSTTCDYCAYKSICSFNTSMKGNEYFKIKQYLEMNIK